MSSWKLYLFLLIVAVGSVVCQDDDAGDADAAPEPDPEPECKGCKDGPNCWREGHSFMKDNEEMECQGGKIQKKVDPYAGMCLAHTAIGRGKWMQADEEYVLRCNTWKCSGEFGVMMFVRAACRDDHDKCFEDGETLVKNGHPVICKVYGSGHVYEYAPEDAAVPEPEPADNDAGL